MYIFISHSSCDAAIASEVCELLESDGNQCFLAPRDIRSGFEYAEEIINGIDRSDAVILLLSQKANDSPHVLREIERAVSKSIAIIVYKLEEVELTKSMEYFLMTHQWVNAKHGKKYADLVDCVKELPERVKTTEKPQDEAGTQQGKSVPAAGKRKGIIAGVCVAVVLLLVCGRYILKQAGSSPSDCLSGGSQNQAVDLQVGDTVVLGTYNEEPISWYVLKISDDVGEAVLISKDILTMKAFDVPDSGKYNYDGDKDYWAADSETSTDMALQARVRGNSDWSTSNIRTWLNSEDETVRYDGQAPIAAAMSDLKNGYSSEAGFLHGFTETELAAIRTMDVKTKGNVLSASPDSTITTRDRVYLLSLDELEWFREAQLSMLAAPTDAAVAQDQTGWYSIYSLDYGVQEYYWWLREPADESSSKCYMVGNGTSENNILTYIVGTEGFGIRPAITVDLHSECIIHKK